MIILLTQSIILRLISYVFYVVIATLRIASILKKELSGFLTFGKDLALRDHAQLGARLTHLLEFLNGVTRENLTLSICWVSSPKEREKCGSKYFCFSITVRALWILTIFFSQDGDIPSSLLSKKFQKNVYLHHLKISVCINYMSLSMNLKYVDSCVRVAKPLYTDIFII